MSFVFENSLERPVQAEFNQWIKDYLPRKKGETRTEALTRIARLEGDAYEVRICGLANDGREWLVECRLKTPASFLSKDSHLHWNDRLTPD